MSLWSRITNAFRADRMDREIDEELESHIDDAIEQGRDPAEARRALGSALRKRESSNVKSTDISILAIPSATILAAALLASLPGVFRAVRIDPVKTLRAE